jgi:hypothetical protein
VGEVVDGLDPGDRRGDGVGVLEVALGHLDPVAPGDVLELAGVADEDPDVVPGIEESGDQSTTDVPGGPGDEDAHAPHGTPHACL